MTARTSAGLPVCRPLIRWAWVPVWFKGPQIPGEREYRVVVVPIAHLALQYNQLVPERGILCFKSALRLEGQGTQVQEEEYQRDHRGRR